MFFGPPSYFAVPISGSFLAMSLVLRFFDCVHSAYCRIVSISFGIHESAQAFLQAIKLFVVLDLLQVLFVSVST